MKLNCKQSRTHESENIQIKTNCKTSISKHSCENNQYSEDVGKQDLE